MKGPGGFKVGVAMMPAQRAEVLSRMCGCEITIVYCTGIRNDAYYIEARAHNLLRFHRGIGEWFTCTEEQASDAIHGVVALTKS